MPRSPHHQTPSGTPDGNQVWIAPLRWGIISTRPRAGATLPSDRTGRRRGPRAGRCPERTGQGGGTDGATQRPRRQLPLPGDADAPHARGDGHRLRSGHRSRRLLVRQDAGPDRLADPSGPGLPTAAGRGPLPPGPSRLGRRPPFRHRLPRPADRRARSRRPPGARRPGRGHRQPSARPVQAAVGDLDRRGRGRGAHRGDRQDAPLDRRRHVRCGPALGPVRPRGGPRSGARAARDGRRPAHPVERRSSSAKRSPPGSSDPSR